MYKDKCTVYAVRDCLLMYSCVPMGLLAVYHFPIPYTWSAVFMKSRNNLVICCSKAMASRASFLLGRMGSCLCMLVLRTWLMFSECLWGEEKSSGERTIDELKIYVRYFLRTSAWTFQELATLEMICEIDFSIFFLQ